MDKSIGIYYFTGTGNSLDVARQIRKGLGDCDLRPLPEFTDPNHARKFSGSIVLVFPAYLMTLPYPVRRFLAVNDFTSVGYLAAVSTGQNKGNLCGIAINRLLKKQNKRLDRYAEIQMPANSPVGLRPTKGDPDWIEKVSGKALAGTLSRSAEACASVAADIASGISHPDRKETFGRRLLESAISALSKNNTTALSYYSDETCNGCGLCAKVCPSGRISVHGNAAEWNRKIKCYYCFACFNACPRQSILLKNWTAKSGRYLNPNVGIEELYARKGSAFPPGNDGGGSAV